VKSSGGASDARNGSRPGSARRDAKRRKNETS
jgi:hypothetical protein